MGSTRSARSPQPPPERRSGPAAASAGTAAATAYFGSAERGILATDLMEVSADPAVLDRGGRWAVVITFEGEVSLARFGSWRDADSRDLPGMGWPGVRPEGWVSSLDQQRYVAGVAAIRDAIARGDVYQVNLCRVLEAELPAAGWDILSLGAALLAGNPAPHSSVLRWPGVQVACASPELYIGREGGRLLSRPIKGTATTADGLSEKDRAENVMIVDLVRNDLSPVAEIGSVTTPDLLRVEDHPGLVHLVSSVAATLRDGAGWPEILAASFPPGSVSGAPKSSALRIIGELEPRPRGPYCGAVGVVDADRGTAELAVGIRSFWVEHDGSARTPVTGPTVAEPGCEAKLCFGTGAGITWGSDAVAEWRETELKARHLLSVASRSVDPFQGSATDAAGREEPA